MKCVQETGNEIRRTRKRGIMSGRSNCRPLLIRNILKGGGGRSKVEEKERVSELTSDGTGCRQASTLQAWTTPICLHNACI